MTSSSLFLIEVVLICIACEQTVFKMDRHGNGEELLLDNAFESSNGTPSFRNFDQELFIGMCVLAGCDFLPSVPGIGIAKAYSMVSKYRNLDRVLSVLKIDKGGQVPEDYSKSFREAVAVFQHARIYDGGAKKLTHIKPLPQELLESLAGELDFLGPEIPPSVASAIAEGHLDPVNMEAFNCSPNSEYHHGHAAIQTSKKLQKPEITTETGFMVFSSQKTTEEITGKFFNPGSSLITEMFVDTQMKQYPVSSKRMYFNEGTALQKLVSPLHSQETVENTVVSDDLPLKVPDNNPFKKRKLDEIHFDPLTSISKEDLVVTGDEKLEFLCATPDSILPKVSENIHPRKRTHNGSHLDQREDAAAQVSVVTEVISSNLFDTKQSQESVNSKPKRFSKGKQRSKTKKTETSNSNNSVNKSTSILNFFSRV
ncbi:hypothetical protein Pint_17004 [Pistacia integerrima]|uniref:Uncharacterized protein n=1 Tax=Pistacia integerrima TaxID=434235 RepID=A0ACC0ZCZ7_9ROSI|nr:hypothetical protein Pint_17004 [Pistacia integerrima]